jgi:hypothetical protein
MTKHLHHAPLYLAALLLACIGLMSTAPVAHANPAEDMAALKNFTLTEGYLHRWMAAKNEAHEKGTSLQLLSPAQMSSSAGHMPPLSKMVDHVDNQPGAHALLASHDMTTRQYVLGSMALMLGELTVFAGAEGEVLNQDNVDFVRTHQDEIKAYLRKSHGNPAQ